MKKYYSPTQVNKFVNCNYQWYYEQIYTRKELSEIYNQYKLDNNITTDKQFKAFTYGNNFHNSYFKKEKRKVFIQNLILIFCIILGVIIWTYYM